MSAKFDQALATALNSNDSSIPSPSDDDIELYISRQVIIRYRHFLSHLCQINNFYRGPYYLPLYTYIHFIYNVVDKCLN